VVGAGPDPSLGGPGLSGRGGAAAGERSGLPGPPGALRRPVAAKAARRRLLRTVTADGEHLYPLWQFDGDGLVPGLAEVLAMFPERSVDGWTLAAWLRTPDPDLGEAPLDALVRGDVERVRAVARSSARALAA